MDGFLPFRILSKPGIKRDGTVLEGNYYTDGRWVRFQRGLPRKIAGYRQLTSAITGIVRGINVFPNAGELFVHLGSQDVLERVRIDIDTFITSGATDRTPVGFTTSDDNLWQFAQMYDATTSFTSGTNYVLAHAAPNALDIAADTLAPVYYGDITATAALTAAASSDVSGGIVVLHPYVLAFSSAGLVRQSVANQPANFAGAGSNLSRVTSKKIVRGLPIRGGAANSPAGLLWSLDSLIKVSFIGGSAVFSYDTISTHTGILAAMSVIEFNGIYYWIGLDRFMLFNGVIQELPNDLNKNFFFENLNWTYRNKVFAFTVPKFGEIWWCFPKGTATEPDYAIIYNTQLNTWYDTELPADGRAAAETEPSFRFPLATGATTTAGLSKLWQHEIGVDEVTAVSNAIRSYFTTGDVTLLEGQPPTTKALTVGFVEPDFIQAGDMTVKITGRANARAVDVESEARTFVAAPSSVEEQLVNFHGDGLRRQLRFTFESNVANGNYQMGAPYAHVKESDATLLGRVS